MKNKMDVTLFVISGHIEVNDVLHVTNIKREMGITSVEARVMQRWFAEGTCPADKQYQKGADVGGIDLDTAMYRELGPNPPERRSHHIGEDEGAVFAWADAGDKVWDMKHGWGVVTRLKAVANGREFTVTFDDLRTYGVSGLWYDQYGRGKHLVGGGKYERTLYWGPVKVISPATKKLGTFKVGMRVADSTIGMTGTVTMISAETNRVTVQDELGWLYCYEANGVASDHVDLEKIGAFLPGGRLKAYPGPANRPTLVPRFEKDPVFMDVKKGDIVFDADLRRFGRVKMRFMAGDQFEVMFFPVPHHGDPGMQIPVYHTYNLEGWRICPSVPTSGMVLELVKGGRAEE